MSPPDNGLPAVWAIHASAVPIVSASSQIASMTADVPSDTGATGGAAG